MHSNFRSCSTPVSQAEVQKVRGQAEVQKVRGQAEVQTVRGQAEVQTVRGQAEVTRQVQKVSQAELQQSRTPVTQSVVQTC